LRHSAYHPRTRRACPNAGPETQRAVRPQRSLAAGRPAPADFRNRAHWSDSDPDPSRCVRPSVSTCHPAGQAVAKPRRAGRPAFRWKGTTHRWGLSALRSGFLPLGWIALCFYGFKRLVWLGCGFFCGIELAWVVSAASANGWSGLSPVGQRQAVAWPHRLGCRPAKDLIELSGREWSLKQRLFACPERGSTSSTRGCCKGGLRVRRLSRKLQLHRIAALAPSPFSQTVGLRSTRETVAVHRDPQQHGHSSSRSLCTEHPPATSRSDS